MVETKAIKWKKSGTVKEATVDGLKVEMQEADGAMMLWIDGVVIPVQVMPNETYFVESFQFQTFDDVDALVRKLTQKEMELREAAE